MRVAILHDHLRFIGGGERVAILLAAALKADLYVTDFDPSLPERAGLPRANVVELGTAPATPLMRQSRQMAIFRRASLEGYEAYVLTGNWTVFAAPRHHPNLWYCLTPVRIFYDLREPFLASLSPWSRWVARRWIRANRPAYESAVRDIDRVVGISRNVSVRIQRYLARSCEIVYPPVDVSRYRYAGVGDFWLAVTRLSHEKRLDLLVEAFRRLPQERLVVAGGPQLGVDADRFVRSLRPLDNVTFLGEIPEAKLLELYGSCRGLVATSRDEDFGLAPVEAMAAGKAVVAVNEGGYRETVLPDETGWLVPASAAAIADAIARATPARLEAMRPACEAWARRFDVPVFVAQMRALIERAAPGVTSP